MTARDSVTLVIDLRGPEQPGRYWIAFLATTETEARFIASGTNWILERPQWFDGNDIVDLDSARLQELDSAGGIWWPWDSPGAEGPVREDRWLSGTTIEVLVR
jgi:hypothetical protein